MMSKIIKPFIIVLLCFMCYSSEYSYQFEIQNKYLAKHVDYETIKEAQYELYMDSLFEPIETFTAELTGYGADCEGCTGLLACKYMKKDILYVQTNGIYINDKEYGVVRVVAADRKYPCGTIMKFYSKKLGKEPIVAVVMDRGGAIQGNRLDLLVESEEDSYKHVGRIYDLKVEVLRKGWK